MKYYLNKGSQIQDYKLTENQKLYIQEVVAFKSEELFGSQEQIDKLVRTNKPIAEKLLDRIKNFIKIFKAKTTEEKEYLKRLQTAEKLFEKALNYAGEDYIKRKFVNKYNEIYNQMLAEENSEIEYAKKMFIKRKELIIINLIHLHSIGQ